VVTGKSDHKLLNLVRRMKSTGMDQLWVADITYIRPSVVVQSPVKGYRRMGYGCREDFAGTKFRVSLRSVLLAEISEHRLPKLLQHALLIPDGRHAPLGAVSLVHELWKAGGFRLLIAVAKCWLGYVGLWG
jgi:hypothetical protein